MRSQANRAQAGFRVQEGVHGSYGPCELAKIILGFRVSGLGFRV